MDAPFFIDVIQIGKGAMKGLGAKIPGMASKGQGRPDQDLILDYP